MTIDFWTGLALFVAAFLVGKWLVSSFREAGRWTVMNSKGEWLQETDPVLWTADPVKALVVRTLKEAIDCSAYVGSDAQPVSWVEMVVRDD